MQVWLLNGFTCTNLYRNCIVKSFSWMYCALLWLVTQLIRSCNVIRNSHSQHVNTSWLRTGITCLLGMQCLFKRIFQKFKSIRVMLYKMYTISHHFQCCLFTETQLTLIEESLVKEQVHGQNGRSQEKYEAC